MVSVGCPESTACPGSVVCWAPTASKTAPGTEVVALTTPDEAGATGGGTTVVEPRVIFTTRRTTTIDRMRTTKTHVTSAMGTRRRGGPGGVSSWVPLSCVVAMVEEPRRFGRVQAPTPRPDRGAASLPTRRLGPTSSGRGWASVAWDHVSPG